MAQVLDITSALQNAQNPEPTIRNQAEEQLSSFRLKDLASYLLSLASELANNQKPAESRQISGLLLKNSLDAPSEANKVGKAVVLGLIDSLSDLSAPEVFGRRSSIVSGRPSTKL